MLVIWFAKYKIDFKQAEHGDERYNRYSVSSISRNPSMSIDPSKFDNLIVEDCSQSSSDDDEQIKNREDRIENPKHKQLL